MNEYYSKGTQIVAVIIAEVVAYVFVILSRLLWFMGEVFSTGLWFFLIILIFPLIFISAPIIFVYRKYECKLVYLLLCVPIIFLCAMIYLPDGWYLLVIKGPMFALSDYKYEKPWVYALMLSIEFLIVQSIPVLIVKGAQKYPTDEMIDEDEKDEKDK